jgi:hypothetical protein
MIAPKVWRSSDTVRDVPPGMFSSMADGGRGLRPGCQCSRLIGLIRGGSEQMIEVLCAAITRGSLTSQKALVIGLQKN